MDAILISNLDGSSQTFSNIAGYSKIDWTTNDAYLFLRRELSITNFQDYEKAYRSGKIRHCKPYRGRWLDYTAKKEFNILEDWVADAGDTIENVLYGVNRIHKRNFEESYKAKHFVGETPKYVTLSHVLKYYGYVESPKAAIVKVFDSFDDIAKKLEINDVPVRGRSCLVKNPNGTIVIARIVDQSFYELDDTESKMCLSVPTDTPYEVRLYDRLSAMPAGSTVYFRSAEDKCFYSIDDLMK